MKSVINDNTYGEIVYEESFWLGRKSITVNGTPLKKLAKNTYSLGDEQPQQLVRVRGGYLMGVKLAFPGKVIQATPAITWYETVLSVLIFVFILIWGNVPALCLIIPVVGGAIGGLISALFAIVNALIIKSLKPVWLKIVVSLSMLIGCFLVCWCVALIILLAAGIAMS